MIPNEPLLFLPLFRSYIWGGRRLASSLQKNLPDSGQWAESWEIVDHGVDQSIVSGGRWKDWSLRQLIESFPDEILGHAVDGVPQPRFPLLLKYLDCNNDLSVQVHPDDEYAGKMETPDLGKTEAWYIVDVAEDAVLYAGLKPGVDRGQLLDAIEAGRTEECLHVIRPQAGDCVFIPAGTVHALGAGLIVAEIQQASDTTFRLFDWNRVDSEGKSRPLHIEQALDVIDFQRGPVDSVCRGEIDAANGAQTLVQCDKFALRRLGSGSHAVASDDRFHILTVPRGSATLNSAGTTLELPLGQSVLLPAACGEAEVVVDDGSVVLHAFVP